MHSIESPGAAMRTMGWVLVLLAAACTRVGAQVPPPPPPQPVSGLMIPPDPRLRAPAPLLPHELRPEAWPQPDYFQLALGLTARKPQERAASLRLRLPPGQPAPAYLVLPVQIQAFGFDASFRALLGAELDLQLERAGVPASTQTDAVDAHGPFVRRLDDAVIADLLRQHPSSQVLMLHAGHDGVDTLFLTLVLRDGKGQRVAHRSLPMAGDALQTLNSVSEALPTLMKTLGLPVQPRPVQAGAVCEASAWKLEDLAPQATHMQKACLALVAGSLLPGFGAGALPPTEARLAWLARAHAYADSLQPASPESAAIVQLARVQLALPGHPWSSAVGLIGLKDPVVARLARLLTLPLLSKSPVQSERDAIRRQVAMLAEGLPPMALAAVEARVSMADPFDSVNLCSLERHYPGAMLGASCRQPTDGAGHATRTASRAEFLLIQEWRIASYYQDLHRSALMLGQSQRARELTQALPADVAGHPFVKRLLVLVSRRMPSTGTYDELLRRSREETGWTVSSMVDLQRHDSWVVGRSLSEHTISNNSNVARDAQIETDAADDSRLLGVLKYDRFVVGPNPPYRRKAGATAFFLRPETALLRFELSELLLQQAELTAPVQPAASQASVEPWRPPPVFGGGRPRSPRATLEEQAREQAASPSNFRLRIDLALRRARHGGSVDEALALIEGQPVNHRDGERIAESHKWAAPAHAFFFAAELEAARRLYQKVVAIGSGSDSDLQARVRVLQLAGRSADAFEAQQQRQQRYDSDFTRRDVASGLFMTGQPDAAWRMLMPRAAMSEWLPFWDGVMVGHRMAGLSPAQAGEWLQSHQLDKVQIERVDLRLLYPFRMAVVDRVPSEVDVELLRRPAGSQAYVAPMWAASALLVKTAMTGGNEMDVRQQVVKALNGTSPERNRFMLPNYVLIAWKATQGKDELLADVREVDLDRDFYGLLAKSVLLSLEGQVDESLRYLTAARISLGNNGPLLNRPIPSHYQWALSAILMHEHTGNEAYRKEILRLARAYQTVFPSLAWPYALEAWKAPEPKARLTAACRAQFLDPKSYFLQRAAVPGLSASACKNALW